jgi:MFS family permease
MSFTSGSATTPNRWRDVWIAAVAKAISYTGDGITMIVLALTLQTRGDNGFGVAAVMLAGTLPVAVLAPVAGRLVDRLDSRWVLITVGLVQAGLSTTLALVSATRAAYTPALMVILLALIAAGLALIQPTLAALTPAMVDREHLGRAVGWMQTAGSMGMLIGPALGGLLVGAYGVRLPLLLDATSFLAIAGAGLLLRTRRGGKSTVDPAAAGGGQVGADAAPAPVWRLRSDRLLTTMVLAFGVVIAAVTANGVVEVFYVRADLGASTTLYGLVSACWTLGVVAGALPFGRMRGSDAKLLRVQLGGMVGIGVVVLVSATLSQAWWLIPLYFCGGVGNAALNVFAGVLIGRRVPEPSRGQAFGIMTGIANGANVFGFALGAVLLQEFTARSIVFGTGLTGATLAILFLLVVRRRDEAEATPVTSADVPESAPTPVG